MNSINLIYLIAVAYFLDLLFGDPYWFPHPVKGIGKAITYFKPKVHKIFKNQKFAGFLLTVIIVGSSYVITWAIIRWIGGVNVWLWFGLSSFLIYTSLSTRSLGGEARKVYQALEKKDLPLARRRVRVLVGRDTENLNEEQVIRATIESVAENSVDGVISPLFYAFLGGAPMALAYKAVNTLDSIVGYKNKMYLDFGRFAAKLDDVANWIPARIAGLLIPLASFLSSENCKTAFQTVFQDGDKSPSPNSGIPQSAFAGALSIQLGGCNFYDEERVEKPLIGKDLKKKEPRDILKAISLLYLTSLLFFLLGIAICLTLNTLR